MFCCIWLRSRLVCMLFWQFWIFCVVACFASCGFWFVLFLCGCFLTRLGMSRAHVFSPRRNKARAPPAMSQPLGLSAPRPPDEEFDVEALPCESCCSTRDESMHTTAIRNMKCRACGRHVLVKQPLPGAQTLRHDLGQAGMRHTMVRARTHLHRMHKFTAQSTPNICTRGGGEWGGMCGACSSSESRTPRQLSSGSRSATTCNLRGQTEQAGMKRTAPKPTMLGAMRGASSLMVGVGGTGRSGWAWGRAAS